MQMVADSDGYLKKNEKICAKPNPSSNCGFSYMTGDDPTIDIRRSTKYTIRSWILIVRMISDCKRSSCDSWGWICVCWDHNFNHCDLQSNKQRLLHNRWSQSSGLAAHIQSCIIWINRLNTIYYANWSTCFASPTYYRINPTFCLQL